MPINMITLSSDFNTVFGTQENVKKYTVYQTLIETVKRTNECIDTINANLTELQTVTGNSTRITALETLATQLQTTVTAILSDVNQLPALQEKVEEFTDKVGELVGVTATHGTKIEALSIQVNNLQAVVDDLVQNVKNVDYVKDIINSPFNVTKETDWYNHVFTPTAKGIKFEDKDGNVLLSFGNRRAPIDTPAGIYNYGDVLYSETDIETENRVRASTGDFDDVMIGGAYVETPASTTATVNTTNVKSVTVNKVVKIYDTINITFNATANTSLVNNALLFTSPAGFRPTALRCVGSVVKYDSTSAKYITVGSLIMNTSGQVYLAVIGTESIAVNQLFYVNLAFTI